MKIKNYLEVKVSNKEIIKNTNFEFKELVINSLNNKKTGAGHYQLSLELEIDGNHNYFKHTTTDMHMIDNMTDDDEKRANEAIKKAVLFILSKVELKKYEE